MSKKIRHHKKYNGRNTPLFLVSVGVALIGVMAILILLFGKQSASSSVSAPSSSRSTVPVEVNYAAPELSLQNVNGDTESLTDYRDKVVLVNNWATWCPPCKAEIPTLEAYYKTHHEEGFVIIGIEAGESQNEVLQFVQGANITYPIWFDLKNASLRAFGGSGLPNSFVIDRKGIIRLAWVGEINREMLEKYVTPLVLEN
jgi:cytochrome c biogenesis protein CcmG, thiol:disulfide interchange protein DsbE